MLSKTPLAHNNYCSVTVHIGTQLCTMSKISVWDSGIRELCIGPEVSLDHLYLNKTDMRAVRHVIVLAWAPTCSRSACLHRTEYGASNCLEFHAFPSYSSAGNISFPKGQEQGPTGSTRSIGSTHKAPPVKARSMSMAWYLFGWLGWDLGRWTWGWVELQDLAQTRTRRNSYKQGNYKCSRFPNQETLYTATALAI